MTDSLPYVFVHGLFGSFCEDETFAQLQGPATAPDLYGYGSEHDASVTFERQVEVLHEHVRHAATDGPVHLVAHSIGAVYAFAVADHSPDLVASVTSVEGNFTLKDAFWSRSIAELDEASAKLAINARIEDPIGFLKGDGIATTERNIASAESALSFQPWRTVWESAKAIIRVTGAAEFETMLHRVFDSTAVNLIAGERSGKGWDVPIWAREQASTYTEVKNVGHMMMLESPVEFGKVIAGITAN
ncbi:hypothetical protein GCM10027022_18050 [Alpinimonas psychrophila]|uniref:Pimeloyl-ACP methyl ester carboxylesterase n=1 Tax=Alpinimonas psychrophila TaxID=748908 RepID=A0A7W3PPJ2_9MICO|nr:alpha/beta hydrolase [Alpinimonas psychrophila]MBA8829336.1 pimeloyl-ACP methyl ester carboxylesterase [Alpinimonas psychrophila]